VDGFKRRRNVGVIHEPAEFRVALAFDDHVDNKTVAMKAAALVRFRQMRQQVRSFKLKRFSEFYSHIKIPNQST
jgi:hypothetical protein